MKRMRPNIPPEPIKSDSRPRSTSTGDLEYPRRHPEPGIRRNNLCTRDLFCKLASFLGCEGCAVLPVGGVEVGCEGAGTVGESCCGAEMGVEVAVGGEDVEFVGGFFFVVAAVGPGAGFGFGVCGCEVDCTQGDAEIEVGEDELDAWNEVSRRLLKREIWWTYVGNSRLANGIPKNSALGFLVLASHPRASFHGA